MHIEFQDIHGQMHRSVEATMEEIIEADYQERRAAANEYFRDKLYRKDASEFEAQFKELEENWAGGHTLQVNEALGDAWNLVEEYRYYNTRHILWLRVVR